MLALFEAGDQEWVVLRERVEQVVVTLAVGGARRVPRAWGRVVISRRLGVRGQDGWACFGVRGLGVGRAAWR